MRKLPKPQLIPSDSYSYLRFFTEPKTDYVEIYLPDDSSYVVDLEELAMFLKFSDVKDYEKLIDFIYNFGNVIWVRHRQVYYSMTREKMLTKEHNELDFPVEEIPYAFI